MITIYHFILLGFIIFLIGLYGMVKSQGSIVTIISSFFIMQAAVFINLIAFSKYHGDISGSMFYMFILATSPAKIVVSLAIMMVCFRKHKSDGEGLVK